MARLLALSTALLLATAGIAAAAPNVVVSIKPLHSLVAAVMEGVGEPSLIVTGTGSEHSYSLRPSQAADLEAADLIFWMGPDMETFLEGPIETIGAGATAVALIGAPGLKLLPFREGGAFEAHDHGGEGHDHAEAAVAEGREAGAADAAEVHDHDEAAGEAHDHAGEEHAGGAAHDHGAAAGATHDHAHEGGHAGGGHDLHVWLDPQNAKTLAAAIETALATADPDNAARYAANTAALEQRLDELTGRIQAELAPVKGRGFVVFHDAYHYFEDRFGLAAAGAITVNPETPPGVERVAEIQARVRELGATCVFAEPQFEPRIVAVVTEGTEVRTGTLDPLGADIPEGPEHYFQLIEAMATSLRECLADPS